VAELVLGEVLVARDHRVELEGALVRGFEVHQVVLVDAAGRLLVGAVLGLLA